MDFINNWENKQLINIIKLNYTKIDDVVVSNINALDYPNFFDAYIKSASYNNRKMNKPELKALNKDKAFIYNVIVENIYSI